jgi:glycosyltransferase involved in cell wall biosynthesis
MDRISVCIATYNGEKFLKQQLESILDQLSSNDEVVISDDNSTDGTRAVIENMSDSRIKLLFNDKKGYVSNFENALRYATGDVIFLSDQDDIWCSNKVELSLKELEEFDLIVSDCKIINDQNEVVANSYYEIRKIKEGHIGNIVTFSYLGCCLAFRSNILKKAMPFPSNEKLCTHDNWLFLIGACFYKHKILKDKLILYRRHNSNASTLISKTTIWFKLRYRIYLCFHLMKRINIIK